MPLSLQLKNIPNSYLAATDSSRYKSGRLEILDYTTYESFSYESSNPKPINKRAIVYLPYGYTPEKKYPIVYVSHGGWSNETTIMGTPHSPRPFKFIIDHAIENHDIVPMIIVNLTYNNTSEQDSSDFNLAIELTERYHNELINDLIPAVESTYSMYASSTSPEDLKASRKYRAFSGFSMGSVNTWRTFEYALDYFAYFNPMSGSISASAHTLARLAHRVNDEFIIYALSGTNDFAYSSFREQINSLSQLEPDTFRLEDNLFFRVRQGASHDYAALCDYTYNALGAFWKDI
ncbi:hypothetical protein EJ419_05775 [Alloscardovia theropitheci]|uniref:Esterase n=1 Tax=Alloscardovia theropitheci TaxID=2496842 RepID=A0A4R0QP22_9BIFI|nr:alpha/beta hydrolase-fold protein [Alloscardovia theropitheci]TCD53944.1 hypothetical protein EJ419_05775 [Alloscardovia theropitheci]